MRGLAQHTEDAVVHAGKAMRQYQFRALTVALYVIPFTARDINDAVRAVHQVPCANSSADTVHGPALRRRHVLVPERIML